MTKIKWLNKKLCSLGGDKVRIELGPQIIKLKCTEANLKNSVTSAHYQVGRKDAYFNPIVIGKTMHCVDWRAKKVPFLWKVYNMLETGEIDPKTEKPAVDKDGNLIQRFIKVAEFEGKNEALSHAKGLI